MKKKISKIELRVDPEFKEQVAKLGEATGQSISEVVRASVEARLEKTDLHIPNRQKFFHSSRILMSATVLTICGIIVSTSFQQASIADPMLRAAFDELDKNGDGVVNRSEFDVPLIGAPSHDIAMGAITIPLSNEETPPLAVEVLPELPVDCLKELEQDRSDVKGLEATFKKFDVDQNQYMTFEEFETTTRNEATERFNAHDSNGDMLLSLDEFKNDMFSVAPALPDACLGKRGFPLENEPPREMQRVMKFEFAMRDRDGDGWISLYEYLRD